MDGGDGKSSMQHRMDDVARFLLAKNYFLTALEFYHETREDGHELTMLRDWFATHYPIAKESADSKESSAANLSTSTSSSSAEYNKDERIAILEYELRIAREDLDAARQRLSALQAQLQAQGLSTKPNSAKDVTSSTSSDNAAVNSLAAEPSDAAISNVYADPIQPHENRILNYLIKKHLLARGFKLTALTLSDEVSDQALDNPHDVSAPIAYPPELHHYVRAYSLLPSSLSFKQTKRVRPENSESTPNDSLSFFAAANGEHSSLGQQEQETTPNKPPMADPSSGVDGPSSRPKKFVLSRSGMRLITETTESVEDGQVEDEVTKALRDELQKRLGVIGKGLIDDADGFVRLVSDSLPHIVPNVLLNKREELIPVIVGAIGLHPDSKVRDSLTHMLFNLIKKPDEKQRKMILAGCISLARILGVDRTGEELLPQCWEQINHKAVERRVLVADSCGTLASFTRPDLRSSLVLSILSQLVDDKSPVVRQAVARNLALLLKFMSDDSKHAPLMDIFMKLISEDTVEASITSIGEFFPHFTEWSQAHGLLCTKHMPVLLSSMEDQCRKLASATDQNTGQCLRATQMFQVLAHYLRQTFPYLHMEALLTAPFAALHLEENYQGDFDGFHAKDPVVMQLQDKFDRSFEKVEDIAQSWPALDWIVGTFLPRLIKMTSILPSKSLCIDHMARIFSSFCKAFGAVFTKEIIKPSIITELSRLSSKIRDGKASELGITIEVATARQLVSRIFIAGVLASIDSHQVVQHVRHLISQISKEEAQWKRSQLGSILQTFAPLCKDANHQDALLSSLCQVDLTQDLAVKVSLLEAITEISRLIDSEKLMASVFPAIVGYVRAVTKP
eukprot:TRINITY_DN7286_c0_g1_i2.p1 TRINITY_DN7286_c0_g1~~TRINITY_DN7286_c0_g1_i2.p1  ORF type:complete len:850 (+),score=168.79 TRINITY_DN7286_c0_g1_i2:62-2611(+)